MTIQSALFGSSHSLSTDDVYTPAWIFDGLGLTFDLDVAAPPGGVPWVPCRKFYTMEDDGLSQDWDGLVWCNPPFSNTGEWARRWVDHPDGLLMAPFAATAWLAEVLSAADVVWVPKQKITDWHKPAGVEKHIPFMTFIAARGEVARLGVQRLADSHGGVLMAPERAKAQSSLELSNQ